MNTRALTMIAVAIAMGAAAVIFASRYMSAQTARNADKIVVAANDIDLGARIGPEMLKLVDWPAGSVPAGAFRDPKQLDTRVARTSLQKGEPVLEGKLAPVGTKGGLSAVVAAGKRAMTVRVNDVIGVAGFALPGNYVDILVSTQEDKSGNAGGRDQSISKIVLERILVLAVAQEAGRDETKPKVVNAVTLEVTPEQAEKLDLARNVGTLSLVLRNQVDPQPGATVGATKASLLQTGASAPAPQVVAAAAPAQPAPQPAPAAAPAQKKPAAKKPAKPAAPKAAAANQRECIEVIRGMTRTVDCF